MSTTTTLPRPGAGFVRHALDVPRLTLNDIAERTGTSREALAKYRAGAREMPAGVRARLAALLERQARDLEAAADLLRRTLEEDAPAE